MRHALFSSKQDRRHSRHDRASKAIARSNGQTAETDALGIKVLETVGAFVFKRLNKPGFGDDPSSTF